MRGAARRAACATGGPGPGRRPRDAASAFVQVRISLAGSVSPPSSPARPAPFGRPFYPLGPFTESLPRKWVETRQLSGRMRWGCTMGRRMLRTLMGTFSPSCRSGLPPHRGDAGALARHGLPLRPLCGSNRWKISCHLGCILRWRMRMTVSRATWTACARPLPVAS